MIQRKRWRLSPAEKIDIWRRWKCGQSQHEIGRAFGRPHPTIRKILLPCGGIAPAPRRRSRLSLTPTASALEPTGCIPQRRFAILRILKGKKVPEVPLTRKQDETLSCPCRTARPDISRDIVIE